MAIQQIYEYSFEMNYVMNNKVTELPQELIKYVMIDYDYDTKIMPIIYVSLTTTQKIFDQLDDNVDKGYISLIIRKKQSNSDSSLWSNYIEGQFTYFVLSENPETHQVSTTGSEESNLNGTDYKVTELALLKTDILNNSKKVYNTVLKNITLMDAAHYGTAHFPMIIEPVNRASFSSLLIPPINTTSKYLKYLNSINELYSTPYRFFIDFNRGYLLSSSGKAVPAKGDICNSVIILEESVEPTSTKFSGQEYDKKQNCYTIRITPNDVVETKNNISNKVTNKIVGVSSSGSTKSRSAKTLKDTFGTEKTSFIRINNENMNSVANKTKSLENYSMMISFAKGEIDSSIITPNMEFNYKSLEVPDYSGRYLLSTKREIFKQSNGAFKIDVSMSMRKIMSQG